MTMLMFLKGSYGVAEHLKRMALSSTGAMEISFETTGLCLSKSKMDIMKPKSSWKHTNSS